MIILCATLIFTVLNCTAESGLGFPIIKEFNSELAVNSGFKLLVDGGYKTEEEEIFYFLLPDKTCDGTVSSFYLDLSLEGKGYFGGSLDIHTVSKTGANYVHFSLPKEKPFEITGLVGFQKLKNDFCIIHITEIHKMRRHDGRSFALE
jgi:hypothetical protein